MVVNVMAIFRILAKSGKIPIKFLSLACYDIWKNFPQTTLSSLSFKTCFSFTPYIFPMLSPKGYIHIAVWLLGNPGCLTVGSRNVSGSHLHIRTASKNLICIKLHKIHLTKPRWSISATQISLSWISKMLVVIRMPLNTGGQWWKLCQNNSNKNIYYLHLKYLIYYNLQNIFDQETIFLVPFPGLCKDPVQWIALFLFSIVI